LGGAVAEEAMLYVVGLGLGDEKDITLRGLEAVRRCDKVYLEAYTSLLALGLGPDATATLVGPSLITTLRSQCEKHQLAVEF
jgi:diphthamide biosynthesis methyltransferase